MYDHKGFGSQALLMWNLGINFSRFSCNEKKKVMRFVESASPENSSSSLKYDTELKISHK